MNIRLIAVLALSGLAFGLTPNTGLATPQDAPAAAATTEDIIVMSDGRELHGQILSETRDAIVFEYVDAKLKIKTKLTLQKDQIIEIKKDVPLESAPAPEAEPAPGESKPAAPAATSTGSASAKKKAQDERTYGASRVQSDNPNVPSLYIVPMKGQMGTDVASAVYEKVRDDIKAKKPDVVVIMMDCQDTEDLLYSKKGKEEEGLMDLDDFRILVNIFRDDLREFRQVIWIQDSVGMSSTVALAWPELFMKSSARLGGMIVAMQAGFESWSDDDVRGKMTAGFMAWIKAFLESGGYAHVLADAMVRPRFMLSASWKGRDVIWAADTDGEYVVDDNDERTAEFRAKDAEDLCISDGTADTLDDLALLLGYREYRVADGMAETYCADYVEDWRRAYEDCKVQFKDYQQFMGWATGEDEVKYLGRAKAALEKVVSYIERYKAVEIRLAQDFGAFKTDLIVEIEIIKERLRALKQGNRGGGGGRAGGGGGGGRAGGGGGGP